MMNLENVKVQELSSVEQTNIDGGCLGCDAIDWVADALKNIIHGRQC